MEVPEGAALRIETYDAGPPPSAPALAARFLTQATFGPTRASVPLVDATSTAGLQAWIDAQMAEPPSLHRAHYRQRVNSRVVPGCGYLADGNIGGCTYLVGGMRPPCSNGSRWHPQLTSPDLRRECAMSMVAHMTNAWFKIGLLLRQDPGLRQ